MRGQGRGRVPTDWSGARSGCRTPAEPRTRFGGTGATEARSPRSGVAAAASGRALTPGRSGHHLGGRAGGCGVPGRRSSALGLSASAEFVPARRDSGSREDAVPRRLPPLLSRRVRSWGCGGEGHIRTPRGFSGTVRAAVARGFEYFY